MMRAIFHAPVLALCLAGALVAFGADSRAQGVQRCESADGKVTYSNTQCPDGTKPVRSVNTSPPVAIDEQKAAKDRAKREATEAKAVEKSRDQEAADAQRAAAEQKKAQAKARERCDKAKKDLAQSIDARAALHRKAATIQQMQKAEDEIAKREREAAKACPA